MMTFSQWLDIQEGVIAKSVIGLGPAEAQGGGVGMAFMNQFGHRGFSTQIINMKNLNIPDDQGRTQWEIKTVNNTYIASMDTDAAQRLATAWQQSRPQTRAS